MRLTIKESMPSIFAVSSGDPNYLKQLKTSSSKSFKDYCMAKGFDIQHTEPHIIDAPSNSRSVNFHDPNTICILVIPVENKNGEYTGDVYVSACDGEMETLLKSYRDCVGYFTLPDDTTKQLRFEKLPSLGINRLLKMATSCIVYSMDDDTKQNLIAQRQARKDSRKDALVRYGKMKTKWGDTVATDPFSGKPVSNRVHHMDKSGYVRDPERYDAMLADLKLGKGKQTLDEAFDLMQTLLSLLPQVRRETRMGSDITRCLYRMSEYYNELNQANQHYDKVMAKQSNDMANFRQWQVDDVKQEVSEAISHIRKYIPEIKQVIDRFNQV